MRKIPLGPGGPGTGASSKGVPGAGLPRPQHLADSIEIVESDYYVAATSRKEPRQVDSRALAKEVSTGFLQNLFAGTLKVFNKTFRGIVQLTINRVGAVPTLTLVPQTANADTHLMPAVDALKKSEPLIRKEVPSALKDVDMGQVAEAVQIVEDVDEMQKTLAPLNYGLQAVRSQAEAFLGGVVRGVYRKVEPELPGNFTLGQDLDPLTRFVTESAQQAVETKKLKQKVAAETEAETLERVKAAFSTTAPGVQPAPEGKPAAPPVPPMPAPRYGKRGPGGPRSKTGK